MYNRRGSGMRRILAGILSAAMIFTTDTQVLWASEQTPADIADFDAISEDISYGDIAVSAGDITVSAGDAMVSVGDITVSAGDAMVSAGDITVSAGDATVSESDIAVSGYRFTLTPADIQYGEDGSNHTGNLDALFAPRYVASGKPLTLNEDYTVTYKFFTEQVPASAEAFAAAEGIRLETILAGTAVTVCALAEAPSVPAQFETATFAVSRRKVVVRYSVSETAVLDGRELPEDGQLVIPQADILPENLTVSVAESTLAGSTFAAEEELRAVLADAIDSDLTLDVSEVDVTEDGYQVVPLAFSLAPDFDDNYEIVGNIFGDVYVKKAKYYVTFTVNNNGEQWIKTYELDYNATQVLSKYSFYNEMVESYQAFLNADASENVRVTGWTVYTDGVNISPEEADYVQYIADTTTCLNADACTYETSGKTRNFELSGRKDYHFVAQVTKAAAMGLYVTTIPSVYYDGRAHVLLGTKVNSKKQIADLRLTVYDNSGNELVLGQDYVVSKYRNNKNASMRLVTDKAARAGSYEANYTSKDQRPMLTVTGKGNYRGFSADVYFDILPENLGVGENSYAAIEAQNSSWYDGPYSVPYTRVFSHKAEFAGFAQSYALKNGKLAARIKKPAVTKQFQSFSYTLGKKNTIKSATVTQKLKEGTDYTAELYLWNTVDSCWEKQDFSDPNQIRTAGNYLYLIRGTGNYCGAVYDTEISDAEDASTAFNYFGDGKDGSPVNPSVDDASPYQFRVWEDGAYHFANTKISIRKKSLPYKEDADGKPVTYRAEDFGITVKNKKGQVLSAEEYAVTFSPRYGHTNSQSGYTYGASVAAANEYDVIVSPAASGNYYGNAVTAGRVKITGLKLKASYFELSAKKLPIGELPKWSVSAAGEKLGLTKSDKSSPYYIYSMTGFSGDTVARYAAKKGIVYPGGSASASNDRYGWAIDPVSTVKLPYSHTPISLQEAVDRKMFIFEMVGTNPTGSYNLKGAVPDGRIKVYRKYTGGNDYLVDLVTLRYSGYQTDCTAYGYNGSYLGKEYLTFTIKNNTKVGQSATLTIKGSGAFKGSCTIENAFTVTARSVPSIAVLDDVSQAAACTPGNLYAVVTDGQKNKNTIDQPKVKLYQAYATAKGTKLAVVKAGQYQLESVKAENNDRACVIKFSNIASDQRPFVFGDQATCGYYALYDSAKLPAVNRVKIQVGGEAKEYDIKSGHIEGFTPIFSGDVNRPAIVSVTLADGTVLENGNDFACAYGANKASGKSTGTVTLKLHYNAVSQTYPYKGKITLKFDIAESSKITL